MLIFVRCLRSLAAVTPVKYKHDIIQVTSVLITLKIWEDNGTGKIDLVIPTLSSLYVQLLRCHSLFLIPTGSADMGRETA